MDNCRGTGDFVAARIGDWLHDGLFYSYPATTREKVIDLGPIHVTAEKTKTIPLTPIVGTIALVGGIVLLVMGSRKG